MMPIKEPNNDQNIVRVFTKMSEECTSQNNNAKLTDCTDNVNYLNSINSVARNKDDLNLPYDHMYASNNLDGVVLNPADSHCQNTESEVKFLKEWLLMHLDLIAQQNDEILNKENTILILKQENEMLKERINCLDRGITFQANNTFANHASRNYSCKEVLEEMTQDAGHIEEDNKPSFDFIEAHNSIVNNCADLPGYQVNHEASPRDKEVAPEIFTNSSPQNTSFNCDKDLEVQIKTEAKSTTAGTTEETPSEPHISKASPVNEFTNNSVLKLNHSNFVVNSSMEDTLKNLRMSIRRKRLCSSSSALSNNEGSLEDPRNSRKKKKRKGSLKDEKILTSNEQYVTQTGEVFLGIPPEPDPSVEIPRANNLEVPRWRVKVYTSCYTLEGTENLDNDVYNKRHMRLENDERRRKRWDVQRIREQRIVEKLKQRQERIGSGSKLDEHTEVEQSLWPTVEDVKYLEVCDQLPVSAFGAPVPRFAPSEFNLPWLNNPHASLKKTSNRKSTIRRKATKR